MSIRSRVRFSEKQIETMARRIAAEEGVADWKQFRKGLKGEGSPASNRLMAENTEETKNGQVPKRAAEFPPKQTWLLDYMAWNPAKGRKTRFVKTFNTKGDADAWYRKNVSAIEERRHVPASQSITVEKMAGMWIDAVKAGRKERGPAVTSTIRQYRYHANTYIIPRLGHRKLGELTRADIIDFKNSLLRDISRPLARKVLTNLKGLLNEALDQQKLAADFWSGVSIGLNGEQHKVAIPSIAEVQALLKTLDEIVQRKPAGHAKAWRRYRALLATAIHTGMREGELRGLHWDAVNLQAGTITVTHIADERGVVAERTKSKAGRRTIIIPPSLVALLREWKMESTHALVFATAMGSPMTMGNIYLRAWKPLQLAAGLCDPVKDENGDIVRDKDGKPAFEPRYRFHDLRHFHASMLIADDANPKEVQYEMGHSNIQITFDLYGHLFHDEEAMKRRTDRAARLAQKVGGQACQTITQP
ncbi:site-specific integrase [Bradyrhizobium sp. BRP14]|nr:site-specific integrase [Bradyrhizobium sp. BRP14]